MTETSAGVDRYAAIIAGIIARGWSFSPPVHESDLVIQVDRGNLFPLLLMDPSIDPDPLVNRILHTAPDKRIAIVDAHGHQRPAYRGLLFYAILQSFRIIGEHFPRDLFGRWEASLRGWCDQLESILIGIDWPAGPMPANRGSEATEACWIALALQVAGRVFARDGWTDRTADIFRKLSRSQAENGAFLTRGRSDNPETHWYHELVLLHCAASYAIQTNNRALANAVAKNAEFQQNETQPDHATTQPWALFAFVWNSDTRPLADQLLHSVQTQYPSGVDGVSRILLGDALYCLKLFK